MDKFTTLTGIAASFPRVNIDTDLIIPKQYLTTIKRTGLGVGLFSDVRYDRDGNETGDFVLNKAPWREAKILLAGDNFGCGSSREHAPWALLDFGIRCVIAPSFADIFYNNCFKNGILPVELDEALVQSLMPLAENPETAVMTVDLAAQEIRAQGREPIRFEIDGFRRHCLLEGLDDIGITLTSEDRITAFEAKQKAAQPWLYAAG
ncbi:MAG: 3-isopropylmalate dehydratase small subunit [Tistrella sp.]|uniref:3-isopropylmalate dehydratase small subunit n=1 Tax=Tistrella mobilis TaxID=171437 RepID=A0A3B9IG52_9PROT|nr:3-isopropylmalate dehydratase small subunit [Tistrella sp.]MAD36916.1 3-isopropylmalate dehydratase small subunit [Tistrella sp.]MBA79205.1 3-isopropylmalate dehydratase small subunit [Tistrella sp.]HAE46844.1 3-isopropylmalate dehydratase small subunit [Tistrella mobilis]|tara:strand:+ start:664 stop:1281 length:618 start_codon:yes stop_codon:yes gene_type:complete